MYSPGLYHKLVPSELLPNLRFRIELLKAAEHDRTIQRGVSEMCRLDFLFYAKVFVWQLNPLEVPGFREGPFIPWPFQERTALDTPEKTGRRGMLWCIEHNRSGVMDKSREMGASWWFLILQSWLGRFHKRTQILNISRSKEAVDDKSMDSLFAKIRFIHEYLPDWLRGKVNEENFFIEYAETKSQISGEASTGKAGVGGRAALIFLDEFSEVREDKQVREKTASTTGCRFFNSTHLGVGTEFYNLTQSPEFVKWQWHWTRHPKKNEGLYSYDLQEHKLKFWEYVEATDSIIEIAGPKCDYDRDFKQWLPDDETVFVFDKTGAPTGGPHPGVRSPWYDWKARDIGSSRGVAMQLDIDPKGAAAQFFDAIVINHLKSAYGRDPDWEGDVYINADGVAELTKGSGPLKLWIRLDSEGRPPRAPYGGGIDVAGGNGCTPSCFCLVNARTGEKILEYANARIDSRDFADVVVAICRLFVDENGRFPYIGWEHTGPGTNFGLQVIALGYSNFYRKRSIDKLGNARTDSIGISPKKKPFLIDYRGALQRKEFLNPSIPALDECLSFEEDGRDVWHPGEKSDDPASARENHGDRVIMDMIGWLCVKEMGKLTKRRKDAEPTPEEVHPNTMQYRFQEEEEEVLVWD